MTDHNRETFEQFIRSQPFYAHSADEDDILERDQDGGYLDSCVHGAWMAWNAHASLPVNSSPDVDAVRWGGRVIICHPGMPAHAWDGETMFRLDAFVHLDRKPRKRVDTADVTLAYHAATEADLACD